MRILFATGRMLYPFFRGGDGTTAAEMLTGLSQYGATCLAIGKLDPIIAQWPIASILQRLREKRIKFDKQKDILYFWTDIENRLIKSSLFLNELKKSVVIFKPDIIITQLEDSELVIRLARELMVPVILYVHDSTTPNSKSLNEPGLTHIFYNSNFIAEHFVKYSAIPHTVVYPVINAECYMVNKYIPFYVTMVNPVSHKGSEILKNCCRSLSTIPFLIVSGWTGKNLEPKDYPNINAVNFGTDMREVYSKSLFMIVPSQWAEPFCRIPIEAGLNGIPTIASNVGGLSESVGDGGILIDNYNLSDVWINSIRALYDNRQLIRRLGIHSKLNARKFILPSAISIIAKKIEIICK